MSDRSQAQPRSPLSGSPVISTVAATGGHHGITIEERSAGLVLQIIARRGRGSDVRASLAEACGLEAPQTPRIAINGGRALVWSGPSQWLLMADAAEAAAIREAAAAIAGAASLSDQSDARVVLRLSGPRTREALAKLVGLDLDGTVFPPATAAMTVIAHMPVHLWRLGDAGGHPVFEIAVAQSYAVSLWHHVTVAAAEFGLEAHPVLLP